MKPLFFLFGAVLALNTHANAQWQWGRSSNFTGDTTAYAEGTYMTTDNAGNVYGLGEFGSASNLPCTIHFGATNFTTSGDRQNVLVKYDSTGHLLWAKNIVFTGTSHGIYSIGADGNGNVYLFGQFINTVTFDSATTLTAGSTGSDYGFIVKYSPAGKVIWAKHTYLDAGYMSVDTAGNIFIAGAYQVSITLGTITLTNASSTGTTDIFVAKYDSSFHTVWAKSAGGSLNETITAFAIDDSDNAYVGGSSTSAAITFGTVSLTNPHDMYVAKFNASGTALWANGIMAGASGDNIAGISPSRGSKHGVYICGTFQSAQMVLGADTIHRTNYYNSFIARYDSVGSYAWVRTVRSANSALGTYGYAMTTDVLGNAWVSGAASPGIGSIHGRTYTIFGTDTLAADSNYDASYIAEYSPTGSFMKALNVNSGGDDYNSITSDKFGNVFFGADILGVPVSIGPDVIYPNKMEEQLLIAKYRADSLHSEYVPVVNAEHMQLYPNPATGFAGLYKTLRGRNIIFCIFAAFFAFAVIVR